MADKNKKTSILIVDDEPDLVEMLAYEFEYNEFEVKTASGGHEAFQKLQSSPADIVLTDVRMPDGDGIELFEKIKAELSPLPSIYFITGYATLGKEEALEKGAKGYFSKPFDLNELIEKIKSDI